MKKESKFNQKQYIQNWVKENYKRYEVKVNKKTEADLMKWLDSKSNRQVYIKDLIKKDMK